MRPEEVPLFHLYGVNIVNVALHFGAAVAVFYRFKQQALLKINEEYKVEQLFLVPYLINFLVRTPLEEQLNQSGQDTVRDIPPRKTSSWNALNPLFRFLVNVVILAFTFLTVSLQTVTCHFHFKLVTLCVKLTIKCVIHELSPVMNFTCPLCKDATVTT
jgi:hypothetical protein